MTVRRSITTLLLCVYVVTATPPTPPPTPPPALPTPLPTPPPGRPVHGYDSPVRPVKFNSNPPTPARPFGETGTFEIGGQGPSPAWMPAPRAQGRDSPI